MLKYLEQLPLSSLNCGLHSVSVVLFKCMWVLIFLFFVFIIILNSQGVNLIFNLKIPAEMIHN